MKMCVSAADVRQVRSAVCLSREASGRPLGESEPGEEALALQEADGGVRRLRAGEPFPEEMSALWLGVQSLAFTLVCEAHENLLLAEGSLRNLSRHCVEQLHMLGQGTEVSRGSPSLGRLLVLLLTKPSRSCSYHCSLRYCSISVHSSFL